MTVPGLRLSTAAIPRAHRRKTNSPAARSYAVAACGRYAPVHPLCRHRETGLPCETDEHPDTIADAHAHPNPDCAIIKTVGRPCPLRRVTLLTRRRRWV